MRPAVHREEGTAITVLHATCTRKAVAPQCRATEIRVLCAVVALMVAAAALYAAFNRGWFSGAAEPVEEEVQELLYFQGARREHPMANRLKGAHGCFDLFNEEQHNVSRDSKVAVMLEPRPYSERMRCVIELFLRELPTDWRVQVFLTGDAGRALADNNGTVRDALAEGRLSIVHDFLTTAESRNSQAYNKALLSPSFWRLVDGERVLIFQLDSALCNKSPHRLSDFDSFDFVGAPWKDGGVGNGGLSLRWRSCTLLLLQARPATDFGRNEDGWYVIEGLRRGWRVPVESVAQRFSVETVFYDRPLGLHNAQSYLSDRECGALREYCPEAFDAWAGKTTTQQIRNL
eukprot:TRINITY_DN5192_c0_g1_i1.p1 TRINITY_DN5192_c0_g1~~TRINITY_DN5192_c0_g1_i1.p1  ORF type:complete len:346 (-),score=67.37 TRINITY_DN5192_c0_g1_i1:29-1066(-)